MKKQEDGGYLLINCSEFARKLKRIVKYKKTKIKAPKVLGDIFPEIKIG